jgi:hypothetical protein
MITTPSFTVVPHRRQLWFVPQPLGNIMTANSTERRIRILDLME